MTNTIINYKNLAQCANQLMEAGRAGGKGDVGVGVLYILYVQQWNLFPVFTLPASLNKRYTPSNE